VMSPLGRGRWRLLALPLLTWPLSASAPTADERVLADIPAYQARVRAGRIGIAEKAEWAERMRAEWLDCGSPAIDPSLARLHRLCRSGTLAPFGSRAGGLSRCLSNLAGLAERKGRPRLAEDLYCEAVHVLDGVEAPPQFRQEDALHVLANYYRLNGREAEQQAALERALAIGRRERVPYRLGESWTLATLADFHLAHGRFAEAAPLLERQIALIDELGMSRLLAADAALARAKLARAYHALGRPADAEPLLERSISFYRQAARGGHLLQLAVNEQELAQIYLEQGRVAAAEPLLRQAVTEWDAAGASYPAWHGDDREWAGALDAYAALLERTGLTPEALPLRRRAEALRHSATVAPRWQPGCPPAEAGPPHSCPLPAVAAERQ
jgi:tetratricopeptide (TPR) repeat protein